MRLVVGTTTAVAVLSVYVRPTAVKSTNGVAGTGEAHCATLVAKLAPVEALTDARTGSGKNSYETVAYDPTAARAAGVA